MKVYLIIVEISGGVNLGLIVRLAENFNVDEVRLVNPKLDSSEWEKARIFSARASGRLSEIIRIYNSFDEAIKDLDYVVGTSAIISEDTACIERRALEASEAMELITKSKFKKVGIVFGREATGLRSDEIMKCDILVNIASNPEYRTLNIANSVAIILYLLYINRIKMPKRPYIKPASKIYRDRLIDYFRELSKVVLQDEVHIERATKAFSNVINRALPDYKETRLIMGILRRCLLRLER